MFEYDINEIRCGNKDGEKLSLGLYRYTPYSRIRLFE